MLSQSKLNILINGMKFFREKQNLIPKSEIEQLFDKIDDKEKIWVDELISHFEEERDKLNKARDLHVQ